jgi:hypothetical protein
MAALQQALGLALLAATLATPGHAGVTEAEAQRLHGPLTPMGAERAGNADGSIPPWTGGLTLPAPGYRQGDPRPDPYPGEQKLFTITAANFTNYASRLPEGAQALFRAMPDFSMNIFPTHRTAAAPQSVYDNVFANATRAHAAPEGIAYGVAGAAGGIPFPIPHNGTEIVWNHLLSFWGAAREVHVRTYVGATDGSVDLTAGYHEITDFPYYTPGATPETVGAYYFKTRRIQDAPAARAEQAYTAWQPIDTARDRYIAWRLLPGEHRVRKAPSLSYDTPDADASGLEEMDDYYLYFGGPDRYIFTILGKREMYVPYNNNRLYLLPASASIGPHHEVADAMRYELHRVWVVEGVLAPGKHHVAPRRRLYIDEDSWQVVYSEAWDEDGKLWKFGHGTMYVMPDVPAVVVGTQFVYDLLLGGYAADFVFAGDRAQYKVTPPHAADVFSAEGLAAGAER